MWVVGCGLWSRREYIQRVLIRNLKKALAAQLNACSHGARAALGANPSRRGALSPRFRRVVVIVVIEQEATVGCPVDAALERRPLVREPRVVVELTPLAATFDDNVPHLPAAAETGPVNLQPCLPAIAAVSVLGLPRSTARQKWTIAIATLRKCMPRQTLCPARAFLAAFGLLYLLDGTEVREVELKHVAPALLKVGRLFVVEAPADSGTKKEGNKKDT